MTIAILLAGAIGLPSAAQAATPQRAGPPFCVDIWCTDPWLEYTEIRAEHSGKCLDVEWGSTAHGANIIQANCWGGPMQRWLRKPSTVWPGYFELRAMHSDKCLTVAWGSTAHGADIIQGDCWGTIDQLWRTVYTAPAGARYEIRALHSDKCLDVEWGNTAHGANIIQANCWGGWMQQWGFYLVR